MAPDFPRTRRLADASELIAGTPEPSVEQPARRVTLPQPMLSYACNQQGCCCRGWRITFQPHDLVRLGRALPAAGRDRLVRDIEVYEELAPDGSPAVSEVYVTDDHSRCRFLEPDDRHCGVHASAGVDPLPDICVDFPVAAYAMPEGAEFYFDPVCPSVLDALAVGDSARPKVLEAPFADGSVARRSAHARAFPAVRFGVARLNPDQFALIRDRVCASLEDHRRPVLEHLLAIDEAYAEVGQGERPPEAFALRYDRDPTRYHRFFRDCLHAHGAGTLTGVFHDYQRFIFSMPHDPQWAPWEELEKHLRGWEAASHQWLDREGPGLRQLHLRYLAHRHFAPFLTIQRKLHFAAGAIVHIYATALRYAAAYGAVLRRPVDTDIMKAAIGTAEYVYRSLEIAPESLPWFGLST
jgi:Fe-S-cluster containining protein